MITHPIPSMHEDIKALWKQTFGDSEVFLSHYFAHMYSDETMLVCVEDDEEIVAMMTMLPVTLTSGQSSLPARYVYAVATAEDWRGLGISTSLMEQALEEMKDDGIAAAILVPAHFSLFSFYERQGFETAFYVLETPVKAADLPKCSGNATPLLAHELLDFRNRLFADSRLFAKWDENSLAYIIDSANRFGGFALKFESEGGFGYAIAALDDSVCYVKELGLFGLDRLQALALLHRHAKANLYIVHERADGDPDPMPFGMIQWLDEDAKKRVKKDGQEPYFELVMD